MNQPVSVPRRRTLWLVGGVLLLAAGGFATWKLIVAQSPAWLSRWRVQHYLKGQAHDSHFAVEEFKFPSKADMAKVPPRAAPGAGLSKGSRTGKEFEALREEYFTLKTSALVLERGLARHQAGLKEATAELDATLKQVSEARAAGAANVSLLESNAATVKIRVEEMARKGVSPADLEARETALAPIVSDLWDFQRHEMEQYTADGSAGAAEFSKVRDQFMAEWGRKYEKTGSYAGMYKLIGQELWVARRLLDSVNPEFVRSGMALALNASQHALNDAQNGWVAARICEGYVLPHLDAADDTNRRSQFNRDNLLNECANIFRRNEEYPGVIRTYKFALAAAGTPQKADSARAQISMAYEQAGDLKQALHYIREIKDTNDFRWVVRRAQRIEQQLKTH
ncbi:MAG: hypothetical protein QOF48_2914 [Verrucomicrobiota bacterium]|jgi:tetratricopeptide (TPR) repeat protein